MLFENPSISQISGSFSYIKYDRYEYVQRCDYGDKKRSVTLSWDTPLGFNSVDFSFDANENLPIFLESQITPGMFSMSPVVEGQWEQFQSDINSSLRSSSFQSLKERGDLDNTKSPYELFNGTDVDDFLEGVFDPTSGTKIVKLNRTVEQVPRAILSEAYADYVLDLIRYNPLSESEKIEKIASKLEIIALKGKQNRSFRLSRLSSLTDFANSDFGEGDGSPQNGSIIGYVVQRFDSNGSLEFSHIVDNNRFIDYSVLYGATYTYLVYPILWALNKAIIIQDEAKITIECEERIPPEPPKDFNIQWTEGNEYITTWLPNYRKLVINDYLDDGLDSNVFTQDVKGYQIFRRSSLTEPYELISYIKFSDLWPLNIRERNALDIPKRLTHDLEGDKENYVPPHPTSLRIKLESNRDHYVTMCAVDARGNPSGYSVQWRIYRNSVTGKIEKELFSPTGAPRNQPNLLKSAGVIQDSFDISGLTKCTIYFNPDSTYNIPDNGTSVDFQFFDTKSDTFQSHKVTITQNTTSVS